MSGIEKTLKFASRDNDGNARLEPASLPEASYDTVGRAQLDQFIELYCHGKSEYVSVAESAFYWFNKVAAAQSSVEALSAKDIQAVKDAIHGIDYGCSVPQSVAITLRSILERQR